MDIKFDKTSLRLKSKLVLQTNSTKNPSLSTNVWLGEKRKLVADHNIDLKPQYANKSLGNENLKSGRTSSHLLQNSKLNQCTSSVKLTSPLVTQTSLLTISKTKSSLLVGSVSKTKSSLFTEKKLPKPSLFNNNLGGNLHVSSQSSLLLNQRKDLSSNVGRESKKVGPTLFSGNLTLQTTSNVIGEKRLFTHSVKSSESSVKAKPKKKIKKDVRKDQMLAKELEYDLYFAKSTKQKELDEYLKDQKIKEKPNFLDSSESTRAIELERKQIIMKKMSLINLVSVALLQSPNLEDLQDPTRIDLISQLQDMSAIEPEFILKLGLYTRQHLNVRVVANFILSFAAYTPETRPYLKKYFCKSIVLPSDWIAVAELYQTFLDNRICYGSLPTSLRKVMVQKFPHFDEYQLAKYNKEKKKKTVVVRKEKSIDENESIDTDSDTEDESDEDEIELKSFTLKQLVRKLHINQPVYYVMCLLGKKYPQTLDSFYKSKLLGQWKEETAGKRMKLATPETWETQVSLKGNKAQTWQDLIDHNKLPFMAMLRNLRNMIISGMSDRYHSKIIKRLTDEKSVVNSRQFPFRFLSAFEVLEELDRMLENGATETVSEAGRGGRGRGGRGRGGRGRGGRGRGGRGGKVTTTIPLNTYNKAILKRYKKALDTSLKIATVHNVTPISGSTLIICDVSEGSDVSNSTRPNASKRTHLEMQLLLALMCCYHCEDGLLILRDPSNDRYLIVDDIDKENILENVKNLKEKSQILWNSFGGGIEDGGLRRYLDQFISKRKWFDSCLHVVLSGDPAYFIPYTNMYRRDVNPTLLYVKVNIAAKGKCEVKGSYNVDVCGFSDQVLRYIAERGSGNQLMFVENIDKAHELEEIKMCKRFEPVEMIENIERPIMAWKTVKVFISSTFKDMHGERDLLTRYVFPELRCWCFNYSINIFEVDLRWGVTEKQAQNASQLETCLNEVMDSDLFIGMIGSRYGWCPDSYDVSGTSTNLDWLKDMPAGFSITELEVRGFLKKREKKIASKASFFIRDNSALKTKDIPREFRKDFQCNDELDENKLKNFRSYVKDVDYSNVINYPCQWGGVYDSKPMVTGLEYFGVKVLNRLWDTIKKHYINQDQIIEDEVTIQTNDPHTEFACQQANTFVGRKSTLEKLLAMVKDDIKEDQKLILLTGQSGIGKTAFMSKFSMLLKEKCTEENILSISYFVEACGSKTPLQLIKHLTSHIIQMFKLVVELPADNYRELLQCFEEVLKQSSNQLNGQQLVILIDGIDGLCGKSSSSVDWLPEETYKNISFVMSCCENKPCYKLLSAHKSLNATMKLTGLDYADRAVIVRGQLSIYGKELDESPFNNQMKILLSKKESGSPLYLQLACEELRVFGVYEKLNDHLKRLVQTTAQLLTLCFDRIEAENKKSTVTNAFALFYLCRQGLSEWELFDLLNILNNLKKSSTNMIKQCGSFLFYREDFNHVTIARALFMKMLRMMKMFMTKPKDDNGSMHLMSNEIYQMIEKRYMKHLPLEHVSKLHVVLSAYYRKQADPCNRNVWNGNDVKAMCELPYHLYASGCLWNELKSLLCDIMYMKATVKLNLATKLLEAFQPRDIILTRQQNKEMQIVLNHIEVKEVKAFFVKNLHILSKYSELFSQQLLNTTNNKFIESLSSHIAGDDLQYIMKWMNKSTVDESCLHVNSLPTKAISCMSLSKDESMVACGMADGQIMVYDKQTNKEIKSLLGHTNSITSCVFAGTTKLCSSSVDGSIALWDIHEGRRLHLIKRHKRQVNALKATKDGRWMLSVAWDNTARLWNVSDGKEAGVFTSMTSYPINSIALDETEKYAALGGWKKHIYIWNILENTKHSVYKGHDSSIRSLSYSTSGRHLASASLAGELILWSTVNGAMLSKLSNTASPVTCLTYSAFGDQLIAGCEDSTIKVWSGNLGCPGKIYIDEVSTPEDFALSVAVHNKLVAVGYNSGTVKLFHINGHMKCSFKASKSSIRSLCFFKGGEGNHLILGTDDFLLQRWDISGEVPTLVNKMSGHTGAIKCVRAGETIIVSASEDTSVRVWPGIIFDDSESESSGDEEHMEQNQFIEIKANAVMQDHTGVVTCCDISPDETTIISASIDRSIILWDLQQALLIIRNAHSDGITSCCWSDVGNYVITGGNDLLLRLWDTKYLLANIGDNDKLKAKVIFAGHTSSIMDVKYKYGCVSSVSSNGTLKVWTHKGVEITTLHPHKARIHSCEIWADLGVEYDVNDWSKEVEGDTVQQKLRATTPSDINDVMVLTASDDGTVKSYFPFKPHAIGSLNGHSKKITDILTTSEEIISSSNDHTYRQWNAQISSTSEITHIGGVTIVYQFDASLSAVGGMDGRISIYKNNEIFKHIDASKHGAVTQLIFLNKNILLFGDTLGNIKCMFLSSPNDDCTVLAELHSPIQSMCAGGKNSICLGVSTYDAMYMYHVDINSSKILTLASYFTKQAGGETFDYETIDLKFIDRHSNTLISYDLQESFLVTDIDVLFNMSRQNGTAVLPLETLKEMFSLKRSNSDSQCRSICGFQHNALTYLVMGNADGTLTLSRLRKNDRLHKYEQQLTSMRSFKAHEDAVTGLLTFRCKDGVVLVVTSSTDSTIKLWEYTVDNAQNMQQVGLYHCNAPVTCLDGYKNKNDVHLVAGDKVGNAKFLSVRV